MSRLPGLRPKLHFRRLWRTTDAVDGDEHRGQTIFSVCDGKTGIGAGDNDIAVANYLNAEIITNYLNAKGHDTPLRITRLIPLLLVHGGPYGQLPL